MIITDYKDKNVILGFKEPEELFTTPDRDECKKFYYQLAMIWHPDKYRYDVDKEAEAGVVFAHINGLYDRVLEKIANGTYERPGFFKAELRRPYAAARDLSFNYKRRFKFELGETFIGEDHVTYILDARNEPYVTNYQKVTSTFKYGSDRMKKEVERYLPNGPLITKLADGRHVVSVPKNKDLFRLRDVLTFYKGTIDPKHVAWIESSLYNLCCYLNFTGLVHSDISLDTYFISPEYHSGALLGGWWYSTTKGNKLSVVPKRTFELLPSEVKIDKRSIVKIDLELVKAVGRELLDSELDKSPEPLRMWLKSISTDKPVDEYKDWKETLTQSFGARKFTKMEIKPEEIYA